MSPAARAVSWSITLGDDVRAIEIALDVQLEIACRYVHLPCALHVVGFAHGVRPGNVQILADEQGLELFRRALATLHSDGRRGWRPNTVLALMAAASPAGLLEVAS